MKVEGQLLDAYERPAKSNSMFMTCYFNIGIDAEIGASKELYIIPLRFREDKDQIPLLQ